MQHIAYGPKQSNFFRSYIKMIIEFQSPTPESGSSSVTLVPPKHAIERLSAISGGTVSAETEDLGLVITTPHATFTVVHWNGNIRMLVNCTSKLTQESVDAICKEIRYSIIGRKWERIYRFGHTRNITQISDDDIVFLSRTTASWCHIRGGAMQIRALCPHCGIRNIHDMPFNTMHHICGPKWVRERGVTKSLIYDCPGYVIDPRAPAGLFKPPALAASNWITK